MIQAGILRDVIDIQTPSQVQDTAGQMEMGFTTIYTAVRAQVLPMSGREWTGAQQVQADVSTRITIRRIPNVTATCRIIRTIETDSPPTVEIYDVMAVLPDPVSGQRYLTLMCAQRIAEGWRRGDQ